MSLLDSHIDDTPTDRTAYWRSLDELADKPAFRDWMSREFPTAASELPDGLSRRRWLQLMGASLALGGLAGCRWEAEEFAPFTMRPQNRTPGEKQYFSAMWELGGFARPLTVTSIDGRPIKIEGNIEHPVSMGASSAFDQALILDLYDPDRSTQLTERGRQTFRRTWEDFDAALVTQLQKHARTRGEGLALVMERSSSPTRNQLLDRLLRKYPQAVICEMDAVPNVEERAVQSTWGIAGRLQLNLAEARVIACFDADPFGSHPDSLRVVGDWAQRRSPEDGWTNRLYSFESHLSLTGSNADHRVPTRSGEILALLLELESKLVALQDGDLPSRPLAPTPIDALLQDLLQFRGQSLLLAGDQQPEAAHAAILRINQRLGNFGTTLELVERSTRPSIDLTQLVDTLDSGRMETLLVLDANPAWGHPQSAAFRQALSRVPFTIHAGTHNDETGRICRWQVPLAHALESWSDGLAADGSLTLGQPMIAPLFAGRSVAELLAGMLGETRRDDALVRQTFTAIDRRFQDSKVWRRAVHDGFVAGSALERTIISPPTAAPPANRPRPADGIELVFTLSPAVWDGRFANNGWLQETPDPVSKLTWDNAAVMSPATAEQLGTAHGRVVEISVHGVTISLPVFALPGVAAGSIQLSLGYGREAAGHVGGLRGEQGSNEAGRDGDVSPIGVDVSVLLPSSGDRIVTGAKIVPTDREHTLATTQDHFAIDTVGLEAIGNRIGELVRTGTLSEYEQHPDFAQHRGPHHPPLESLWEEKEYEGHAWGMAIDLNRCIGCNACMVGCQSENNVPIVGKEQVLAGREMHWLRIDRYFAGEPEDPEVAHQPLACHHCENAPCEQVCPVAATVHSDEGLNDMVYNRCIGTRYCANNCPYKVRRFNFFDYNAPLEEPGKELVQLSINPEVTVRSRGVMEKCTYCVQRIQDTKIDAKNGQRPIADGEIQTACQQACPAQAIVFGDLNDSESRVSQLHADNRAYGLLAELNTKPRTMYLAKLRNPHPWLDDTPAHHDHADHAVHDSAQTGGHADHHANSQEGAH